MYSAFRKELKSQVHQLWYKMKYFSSICNICSMSQNSSLEMEMNVTKNNDIQQNNKVCA